MPDDAREREAFEADCKAAGLSVTRWAGGSQQYCNDATYSRWQGWLARARRESENTDEWDREMVALREENERLKAMVEQLTAEFVADFNATQLKLAIKNDEIERLKRIKQTAVLDAMAQLRHDLGLAAQAAGGNDDAQ